MQLKMRLQKAIMQAKAALVNMCSEIDEKQDCTIYVTLPKWVVQELVHGWDIYPDESEGYYDQHDENCDKEDCSECEEAKVGQAQYEAENKIANQRERWEADQEEIPSDRNEKR